MPASATSPVTAIATRLLKTRWIVRAPIWLYRARLGFVFGSRLLMLEHTGRKTGTRRYVVLEAADRAAAGTYVVAAGFGSRAQWLRNIRANPSVRVWIGSHRPAPAQARQLTPQETAEALTAYAARHPRAWAALRPVFEATLGTAISTSGTTLPMVALDLAEPRQSAPTGQSAARSTTVSGIRGFVGTRLGKDRSDTPSESLAFLLFMQVKRAAEVATSEWSGAGSNRRPSAFQADAHTD
jgi:deazaflavin-dependent oxidoreductase (nitroreductase family)